MGQKKIKPFYIIWPLILRKVAPFFWSADCVLAWCWIWRVTEVKGTVDRRFTGVFPLALKEEGQHLSALHTLCIGPGVRISERELFQEWCHTLGFRDGGFPLSSKRCMCNLNGRKAISQEQEWHWPCTENVFQAWFLWKWSHSKQKCSSVCPLTHLCYQQLQISPRRF